MHSRRRDAVVTLRRAALLLVAFPAAARAQSAEEPNLIFSVSGGYLTGGALWSLPQQQSRGPSGTDTLALARRLRPGFTAIFGATLFRSPHLGYTVEAGFFALDSEARCSLQNADGTYKGDANRINEQACTSVQGEHIQSSLAGFQLGLVYRFVAQSAAEPYLRATAGLGVAGNSFVQTVGRVYYGTTQCSQGCARLLLDEAKRRDLTLIGTIAAGLSLTMGPGYRFRMEARDAVVQLPEVTGPASDLSALVAPTVYKFHHVPVITFGLDVVLEHKRTRRY